jgi:hypothetical protein
LFDVPFASPLPLNMKLVAVTNTMDESDGVMCYVASCANVKNVERSEVYPETHIVITIDPEHVQELEEYVQGILHAMYIEAPSQQVPLSRRQFTDLFSNLAIDYYTDEYYVVVTDALLDSMGFGNMFTAMKITFGVKSDDILHKTHYNGVRILNPLVHTTKSDKCLLFKMQVPQ